MLHKNKLPVLLAITLFVSFCCANVRADEGPTTTGRSTDAKYMFTDELEPGMKGYGLTVFAGAEIEKFDVEILSVLYGIGPGSDLILARVAGGPIERAGVIAGMSGSPIYINDRMVGALAYSWMFSTEPIAGITPIEEMLRIFDFERKEAPSMAGGATAGEPVAWAGGAGLSVNLPDLARGSVEMRPIATPMVFSGFSSEAIEMFRPRLEGWGIVPVVGGSFSGRLAETEATLEEGAAVGILLVDGDMVVAGIGTVTLNDNGRVLAFGHPFMRSGRVDFPMSTAYIHTILPSMVASSKVGTPLKSVGVLTQDRSSGIGGVVGESVEMAPIALRIKGEGIDSLKTYNFRVVRHRRLLPALAGMALRSSLSQSASYGGDFAAKVHYEIELAGLPTIRNDSFISGHGGFPVFATLGLYRDLATLLDNQFTEVRIESVSVDVEVKEIVESARLTSARISKETFRPGEDIEIKVVMQPYLKEPLEKRFALTVPEHFPEGEAFVLVSSAPETSVFEAMRAPHRFRPSNIEDLVRLIDEDYPANRLDLRLLVADPGMVVGGREMPALPSSVFAVMSNAIGKEQVGITRASVMLGKQFFMDFEFQGSVVIPIKVEHGIF